MQHGKTMNKMNSVIKLRQGDQELVTIGHTDAVEALPSSMSPIGIKDGRKIYKNMSI